MALPRRFRALLSVTPILARRTSACRKKALRTGPAGPAPLCLRVENDHHPPPTVIVVPVTHSPSGQRGACDRDLGENKASPRLGLDTWRSWMIVNEANIFAWPDPELREAGNPCLWFVAWRSVSRNARASFARGCCGLVQRTEQIETKGCGLLDCEPAIGLARRGRRRPRTPRPPNRAVPAIPKVKSRRFRILLRPVEEVQYSTGEVS